MENSINGKIVYVTGGANGLGKAIVTLFCENGADVTFCDIDSAAGKNLSSELSSYKCSYHEADISDAAALEHSVNRVIMASTRYLMSEPNSEAYAASKGAIFSLTHALAMSLSKYKIIVNSISPGWIETGNYDSLSDLDHSQHPSGRVGKPEDIARTCLFLCQRDNDFINGQNIVVDGGMTKKMIYQ